MSDESIEVNLSFSRRVARQTLRLWGYELRRVKVHCRESGRNNDVDYWDETGTNVYKAGKLVKRSDQYCDAVEEVFQEQFQQRLLTSLKRS